MSDPVLELLKSKGVPYSYSGKDYVTKCFNPEHTDSHPSFRIDKATGIAHCFSCGFKTNIFKFYGVLTNNISIRIVKLKAKLQELKDVDTGVALPKNNKPYMYAYRGISKETYKYFEAFVADETDEMSNRVFIPIKDIQGRVVSYTGRHLTSNSNPRYLNLPPGASTPLFPAKLEGKPKHIILVEGIFDMLNMYDKGARNVVCTFGTVKLLSDVAQKLFAYKVMGVEKIFLLFDGDDAGKAAADKTKPLIEDAGFICEIIHLNEGDDPGSIDQEFVSQIIEYTK